MGSNQSSSSRPILPIPDNLTPELVQYCVTLPNDDQWLQLLAGKLKELATWTSYDPTPGETIGVQIAAIWEQVRDLLPSAPECGVGMFKLREKPDDPCTVEQSLDGGITWEFAFTKDCGPGVTLFELTQQIAYNQQIQSNLMVLYNEGDVTTINEFCPSEFVGIGGDAGKNALCLAVEAWMKGVIVDYRNRAAVGLGIVGVAAALTWLINPIIGIGASAAIAIFFGSQAYTYLQACENQSAVNNIICCITDALWDLNEPVNFTNWLHGWIDSCNDWTVDSDEYFLMHIMEAAAQSVPNFAVFIDVFGNAYQALAAGMPVDCVCGGWCYLFDFTTGEAHGWTAWAGYTSDPVLGSGYTSTTAVPGNPGNRQYILLQLLETFDNCDQVEVVYSSNNNVVMEWRDTAGNRIIPYGGAQAFGTERHAYFTLSGVEWDNDTTHFYTPQPSPTWTLHKIIMRGHGTNPFGSDNC